MRVFVTGASGFVGSAVVPELIGAGHQVVGLARSEASAKALTTAGATVLRGDLGDLDSLRRGAQDADGVIHLAFNHDFANYANNGQLDRDAIDAMGDVLAGTGKPLIVTSGTGGIAVGQVATEDMAMPDWTPRKSESAVFAFTDRNVRTTAIRLAPSTHGRWDKNFMAGFVSAAIEAARAKGVSPYVSDGQNRWTAVHRLDAARLYRLALEKGVAGRCYHAIGDEAVPFKSIAETIGRRLAVPVKSIAAEDAAAHFGFISMFTGLDIPASSAITQAALGWKPREIGLLADIEANVSVA